MTWVHPTHLVSSLVQSLVGLGLQNPLPHVFVKDCANVEPPTYALTLKTGPAPWKRKQAPCQQQGRAGTVRRFNGAAAGSSSTSASGPTSTPTIVRSSPKHQQYCLQATYPAVLALPSEFDVKSPAHMVGRKIAHWFHPSEGDAPGTPAWHVSTIVKQRFVKKKAVAWWCRYVSPNGDPKAIPQDWHHFLLATDYGTDKWWVLLETP